MYLNWNKKHNRGGGGGDRTIKLGKLLNRNNKTQNKRGRKPEVDNYDEFSVQKTTGEDRAKKRRREDNPVVRLRLKFTEILDNLHGQQDSVSFRKAVDNKKYPDYALKVKTPMDLKKMSDKNNNTKYRDTATFLEDVNLIFNNSNTYNGPQSQITQAARSMYSTAQGMINADKGAFELLEMKVARSLNIGKKGRVSRVDREAEARLEKQEEAKMQEKKMQQMLTQNRMESNVKTMNLTNFDSDDDDDDDDDDDYN